MLPLSSNSHSPSIKAARLEFRRLNTDSPALVRVRLHTGRTHQIRVQFASRGFPLLGDRKYGAKDEYSAPMLYSCAITFPHQGETKTFSHLPDWAAEGQNSLQKS